MHRSKLILRTSNLFAAGPFATCAKFNHSALNLAASLLVGTVEETTARRGSHWNFICKEVGAENKPVRML